MLRRLGTIKFKPNAKLCVLKPKFVCNAIFDDFKINFETAFQVRKLAVFYFCTWQTVHQICLELNNIPRFFFFL